ncbi:PAS domain-containing sensor histidine kinase [Methanogenium sp. S4BF]|uniref:sensor histidine kinase n=1 Tax=Methanogenium sp. S4BF TaxID=1789226 RepID=UPI002415C4F2|nr:PAS domain-containing sensor histidine kinase [Methanogenium sp. S4BF]WFN34640.1 PAS domain-containing sensor histidine kinase [Methanogenium sp. S4BF]
MRTDQTSEVSKNLSIVNELAFSIGNSLDLQENSDTFCTLLLARKNYSFVSLWLRNDVLKNGGDAGDATCVYAYPLVMADFVTLPITHPLFTPLTDGKAVSYAVHDLVFSSLVTEKQIRGGAYALYPLGDYGILKIYAQNRNEAFSAEEMAQLRNVVRKFAVSVRGCLSHKALVDEVRERTAAEKRLKYSKNALQTFIDSIPENAALFRRDGSVIIGNEAFLRHHSLLRNASPESGILEYDSPVMNRVKEGFIRVIENMASETIEVEWGSRVTEVHLSPVFCSRGDIDAVALFSIDVTEKKKEMLEQLRKSEQQFRELADFIPIILYESDEKGSVTFANQTAFSSMKFGPELPESGLLLRDCVIPEDVTRAEKKIADIASGDRIQAMQFTIRRMDGTTFPALVYSSPIIRDGEFGGIHGAVIDISDQVMAEEALRRTNLKLALLSSVTRHDILNQVTAMLLFKELLADSLAAGDPVDAEYVSDLFEIAETIERQIIFSRDYQDIGMQTPQWQHICSVIRNVSQDAELSALTISCNTGDLEIYADPLFEKVAFNLMENSLRHGFNASSVAVTWMPNADGSGTLTFADDGVGVPDGMKERIFEKGFGSNTGYGLYLIREILDLTGIGIEEAGTVGRGAAFSLTIPPGACRNIPPVV